ncbi:helix-turn-helix domain-containing protein (plasmid) [Bacillus cereus]|uniref:phBC6A51 family helix-turn-helix protein n=1 Tax=Bacillus cereus TaxID=1396 RepID=UPI001B8DA57C|nr:phBC6A51 family helix-turn-helix protein [Bacillus cereus]QUW34632.1 helix-turn-helix domain-containing protein [Bacillus cereus]
MKQRPLTPNQLEILTQIFERSRAGETVTAIAKDMGIDRRTIYNWRSRPEWLEMEKELQRRLVENAYESVMEGLTKNALATKSPKWVELYLKATGKLKDVSEVQTKQAITIKEEGITDDMFAELDRILDEHGD